VNYLQMTCKENLTCW